MLDIVRLSRAFAVLAVALATTLSVATVAHAAPQAPNVPPEIAVPKGAKLFDIGRATGVQIYQCIGTTWTLVAPRVNLVDDKGKLIITHFAGPSWQAKDGSVVGVDKRLGLVTPDTNAIPWLLLSTKPTGRPGRLAQTTFIQRINTTGGLAPTEPCGASNVDQVKEVPYTADYTFWKKDGV
jgi:Protein of unknown function (DUF3455)